MLISVSFFVCDPLANDTICYVVEVFGMTPLGGDFLPGTTIAESSSPFLPSLSGCPIATYCTFVMSLVRETRGLTFVCMDVIVVEAVRG